VIKNKVLQQDQREAHKREELADRHYQRERRDIEEIRAEGDNTKAHVDNDELIQNGNTVEINADARIWVDMVADVWVWARIDDDEWIWAERDVGGILLAEKIDELNKLFRLNIHMARETTEGIALGSVTNTEVELFEASTGGLTPADEDKEGLVLVEEDIDITMKGEQKAAHKRIKVADRQARSEADESKDQSDNTKVSVDDDRSRPSGTEMVIATDGHVRAELDNDDWVWMRLEDAAKVRNAREAEGPPLDEMIDGLNKQVWSYADMIRQTIVNTGLDRLIVKKVNQFVVATGETEIAHKNKEWLIAIEVGINVTSEKENIVDKEKKKIIEKIINTRVDKIDSNRKVEKIDMNKVVEDCNAQYHTPYYIAYTTQIRIEYNTQNSKNIYIYILCLQNKKQ
jgi:hypothetical protein